MELRQKYEMSSIVRVILLIVVVCVAAFYLKDAQYTELFNEILRALNLIGGGTLALVLALSIVNYLLRFARWSIYVGEPSQPLSFQRHLAIYIAGFALTVTPSKAGEAIRAFYLRPFGISYTRCFSALYAERVMDMMVISGLATLVLAQASGELRWLGLLGGAIALALVALQHPIMHRVTESLTAGLSSARLRTVGERVIGLQRQVTELMRPRLLATAVAIGALAWGAEGVGLYLVAQELGIDIGFWPAIGIYAIAVLAGALTFLPGGIGGTELVMTSLLMSAGADSATAIAATAVVRLATLWLAVALGAAAWLGIEALPNRLVSKWGHRHSED